MISVDNLKLVLQQLNFITDDNQIYSKEFANNEAKIQIKVNFTTEKIIYPDEIQKGDETTCNFSHNENFVVLECVNRLLDKGYKAEHIQLEPRYKLGHDSKSSGKADILVKNNQDKTYLFIECKTFGGEFTKEWNNMLKDGGQLFSYFQQDKNAEFLCLYSSDFDEQYSQIKYENRIIKIIDNEQYLQTNNKQKSYKQAKNTTELFEVWKNIYEYDFQTYGIFEDNINAYAICENALCFDYLQDLDEKGKYNDFAEILRQHNVSGKENAFDKLVNLFLCKIYDENHNKENLQFGYRGVTCDTYEDLQDRLMQLYKDAMKEYLQEDITYVSNEEIDKQFIDFEQNNINTNTLKVNIHKFLRELKFYSHSDFSFLEVHNEKLFQQNSKILVKVVQLFQNYKLTQNKTTQILGNLFELFLQKGMKQDEGQFFTPLQICEFIIYALPLAEILSENPNLKVIDYACGAGHFLNTYANIAQQICPQNSSQIYGIEKEYRLSKVAKVSSAMYGHNINFVYADALDINKFAEKNFDLLIANPPYSVKGFLNTLDEKIRKTYELYNFTNTETNSIECFFIELANKILASNAYVAIILPSSVLNKDGIYEKTREIILSNFNVIAINELPSGTFGATGTNTVILFLHKKITYANGANSQRYANLQDNIKNPNSLSFANNIYLKDFLEKYCKFMNYEKNSFITFLDNNGNSDLDPNLQNHDNFAEYKIAFEKSTIYKNLQKSKNYKDAVDEIKVGLKNKEFIKFAKAIEIDKFLYFSQIETQQTLIIKAPSDNKAIKKFLGYEWSDAKGKEGIHELNSPYCSPLYERENMENRNKIAYLIRQRFLNKNIEISPELSEFVCVVPLIACIDFKSSTFNKAINLSSATNNINNINISSPFENAKFPLVKLGTCGKFYMGGTPSRQNIDFWQNGTIKWLTIGDYENGDLITQTKELITQKGLENSSAKLIKKGAVVISIYATIGRVGILGDDMATNQAIVSIIVNENFINTFVMYILSLCKKHLIAQAKTTTQQNINLRILQNIKIPLPPLDIQKEIVKECEKIETKFKTIRMSVEEYQNLIKNVFEKYLY